jgi:hypothetical protein
MVLQDQFCVDCEGHDGLAETTGWTRCAMGLGVSLPSRPRLNVGFHTTLLSCKVSTYVCRVRVLVLETIEIIRWVSLQDLKHVYRGRRS